MRVLLGVINDIDNKDQHYLEKLTNLTDFWIFNAVHNTRKYDLFIDTLYFKSENEALIYSVDNNYDFLIGNWIGHLLRPAIIGERHVIKDTIEFCKNNGGLIGHIISHESKIPYFYKEFWCIEVSKYKNYGLPKWEINDNDFPPIIRSQENFHDEYTPFWISKSDEKTESLGLHINWGCGLIKSWIENGEKISNIPKEIRELKHHLYPEHEERLIEYLNSKISVNDLDQPLQKQYFSSVDYENSKNSIFLFNTDSLSFRTPNIPINNLISVCAAFRPYLILHKSGFDTNTKVKFIDYSQISLDFKKWLVDHWDGVDIFNAVTQFEQTIGKPISWNKPFHKSYGESLNEVIQKFGTKNEWLEFWSNYRKLKHEYYLIDLVTEVNKLEDLIDEGQNYIYFSNSYNTEAGLIKWGKTKLRESLKKLLDIAKKSNSIVDGSDVDHHYPDPNFSDIIDEYEY